MARRTILSKRVLINLASASKDNKMWHVYIIECQDGKFYTGITQNLEQRLREHTHLGSHFTSYNPIKQFLCSEEYLTEQDAKSREAQIKRWSRAKKLSLIKGDLSRLKELSKSRD